MSVITNLILHIDRPYGNDPLRIAELGEYFGLEYRRAFVSIHDETLPDLWYGGHNKGFEAEVLVGVYNHLNLPALVNHLREIHWESTTVQLMVREQEDDGFRIITVKSAANVSANEGTELSVIVSHVVPEKRAVFALVKVTEGVLWNECFQVLQSSTTSDKWYACRAPVRVPGDAEEFFNRRNSLDALVLYPEGDLRSIDAGETLVSLPEPKGWDFELHITADAPPKVRRASKPPPAIAVTPESYRIEHLPYDRFGRPEYQKNWSLKQVIEECLKDWEGWGSTPTFRVSAHHLDGNALWTIREQVMSEPLLRGPGAPKPPAPLRFIVAWKIVEYEIPEEREKGYVFTPYSERGAANWVGYACPLQYLEMVPVPDDPHARRWRRKVQRHWHQHRAS